MGICFSIHNCKWTDIGWQQVSITCLIVHVVASAMVNKQKFGRIKINIYSLIFKATFVVNNMQFNARGKWKKAVAGNQT